MKRLLFVVVFLSAIPLFSMAQDSFEQGLRQFRLENGLEVFVLPEMSDATVRAELVVRAGYMNQSETTAGYIPLYASIFFSQTAAVDLLGNGCKTDAECAGMASRYTMVFPPQVAEYALGTLSELAFSPLFTDEVIMSASKRLDESNASFATSPSQFINATLDSAVTGLESHRLRSGVSSVTFAGKSAGQIRSVLNRIAEDFYVPANCALFLSGALNVETVEPMVQRLFSSYKNPMRWGRQQGGSRSTLAFVESGVEAPSRKYVLVSDSFSKDLNQIVLQFPATDSAQGSAVSALLRLLTERQSALLVRVAEEPDAHVLSPHYISATEMKSGLERRLVVQALSAVESSPAAQADALLDSLRSIVDEAMQSGTLEAAVEYTLSREDKFVSAAEYMESLGDFFAAGNHARDSAESTETVVSLALRLLSDQYFVFVLVHPEHYAEHGDDFSRGGFTIVRDEECDAERSNLHDSSAGIILASEAHMDDSTPLESYSARMARTQLSQFSEFQLSNGIPVFHKFSPPRSDAIIRIEIDGGERCSANGMPGLETLLVRCLAGNMARVAQELAVAGAISTEPVITSETRLEESAITFVCDADDFEGCVQTATGTIVFGDVSPTDADEAVYNIQRDHRIASADISFQMYCTAMQQIYAGSEYEPLFDWKTQPLFGVDYASIRSAYTNLLNAARYRVVVVSSHEPEFVRQTMQKYFGALVRFPDAFSPFGGHRPERPPVYPSLTDTELYVRLNRVFKTDIPAEKSGERPAKLVPTLEFNDPVHYYVPAPQSQAEIPLYNALLYELERRLSERLGDKIAVMVRGTSVRCPFGCVQLTQVPPDFEIDAALRSVLEEFALDLDVEAVNPRLDVSNRIKAMWVSRTLLATSSNVGTATLVSDGIVASGNPAQYILDYDIVENATAQDFLVVMRAYLLSQNVTRVYSIERSGFATDNAGW